MLLTTFIGSIWIGVSYMVWLILPNWEGAEYTVCLDSFNAKRGLPIQARQNLQHAKNRLF